MRPVSTVLAPIATRSFTNCFALHSPPRVHRQLEPTDRRGGRHRGGDRRGRWTPLGGCGARRRRPAAVTAPARRRRGCGRAGGAGAEHEAFRPGGGSSAAARPPQASPPCGGRRPRRRDSSVTGGVAGGLGRGVAARPVPGVRFCAPAAAAPAATLHGGRPRRWGPAAAPPPTELGRRCRRGRGRAGGGASRGGLKVPRRGVCALRRAAGRVAGGGPWVDRNREIPPTLSRPGRKNCANFEAPHLFLVAFSTVAEPALPFWWRPRIPSAMMRNSEKARKSAKEWLWRTSPTLPLKQLHIS